MALLLTGKQTTRLSDCIVAGQSVFVYSLLPFLLSGCLVSCVCGFTVYGLNLSIARNSFACLNDQIKKADNGTYYFRANLGFDHSSGKRIQKYRSGFKTKKEAKEEYAKLVLQFASQSLPTEQKRIPFGTFIEGKLPVLYVDWLDGIGKLLVEAGEVFSHRTGAVLEGTLLYLCLIPRQVGVLNERSEGNALRCLRPCRHIGYYGKEPVTDGRQRSWAETACGLLDA